MSVAEPVASEIVYLHVNKLPLNVVMATLANVTASTWTRKGDGTIRLERPKSRTNQEYKKLADRRRNALNIWRDKLTKCLQIPFEHTSLVKLIKEKRRLEKLSQQNDAKGVERQVDLDRVQGFTYADPAYRALARTVLGLDLTPVTNLSPQQSIVFTLNPNRAQLPLLPSSVAALKELQREQLIWGKALRTATPRKGQGDQEQFSTDETIKFFANTGSSDGFDARTEPWSRTLPYKRTPVRAMLTIECYSEWSYQVHLKLFAANSALVLEFDGGDVTKWPEHTGGYRVKGKSLPKPKPSKETLALWARMKGHGETIRPAIATLQRFLDDPQSNDPLWLGNQEILDTLASSQKKSVIACLPDSMGVHYSNGLDLKAFLENEDLKVTESPSLLRISPFSFAEHWNDRSNRVKMAACAKSYREQGRIDLLSFVRLIGASPDAKDWSLGGSFSQLIDPEYRPGYGSYRLPFQSAFTHLLANLSNSQIARLKGGHTIPYSELSTEQRKLVGRIVYGVRVNIDEELPPNQTTLGYEAGPTFELPKGVNQGAGLSADFGTGQVAQFHNGTGGDSDVYYTYDLKNPRDVSFWSGPGPRIPSAGIEATTFTLHPQNYITIKCALRPGHFIVGPFTEPPGMATAKPVPMAELPKNIQQKLAKVIDFLGRLSGGSKSQGAPLPP